MVVPSLETLTFVAGVEPNETVVPLAKPVPVIVTCVPPVAGPEDGTMLDTVAEYVKSMIGFSYASLPSTMTVTG